MDSIAMARQARTAMLAAGAKLDRDIEQKQKELVELQELRTALFEGISIENRGVSVENRNGGPLAPRRAQPIRRPRTSAVLAKKLEKKEQVLAALPKRFTKAELVAKGLKPIVLAQWARGKKIKKLADGESYLKIAS